MKLAPICVGLLLVAGCSGGVGTTGDPLRGAQLHDSCLGCHGTELYVPASEKVKTLSELRKEVENWNDRMNPKFDKQEVEDITAYLNGSFYKFQ